MAIRRANRGKVYRYLAPDGQQYALTLQEKKFCDYYLEFKASGVDAVYKAGYHPKHRKAAASIASDNLIKPHIFNYINMKLEEYGFTDDNVVKQHLFLLNQDSNLPVKAEAVHMFYKKKGLYAPESHRITQVDPYEGMSDDEIAIEKKRLEKELVQRYRDATAKKTTKGSPSKKGGA